MTEKQLYCKNCKYYQDGYGNLGCCELSHFVVLPTKEHNCALHNADLSEEHICYNCKYYRGGGDWGLFCSHKSMYHHLGKFSDKPCEYYERKVTNENVDNNNRTGDPISDNLLDFVRGGVTSGVKHLTK